MIFYIPRSFILIGTSGSCILSQFEFLIPMKIESALISQVSQQTLRMNGKPGAFGRNVTLSCHISHPG